MQLIQSFLWSLWHNEEEDDDDVPAKDLGAEDLE